MPDLELTICICAYNAEEYLANTLNSIYSQTVNDFKLLVIDDCSTDHTREIVKDFFAKKNVNHAEIVTLEKNRGTAYARNYALSHIKTPLMMFFDADDIAQPNMVQKLYQKITSDDNLIAVSCYCDYMDSNGKPLRGGLYLGPKTSDEFLQKARNGKMMFMPIQTMFRREWALKAGGYRQAEWFPQGKIRYEDLSEDVDLWGRMSDFYNDGKIILTLPEVLFYYRKNTNTLSTGFAKSRAMGQKLMYIKANQLRRRSHLSELKFNEFWNSLGVWKKFDFERRNLGSYFYRQACFAWVQKNFFRCAIYLIAAGLTAPLYPLEKYRSNFRKKKHE